MIFNNFIYQTYLYMYTFTMYNFKIVYNSVRSSTNKNKSRHFITENIFYESTLYNLNNNIHLYYILCTILIFILLFVSRLRKYEE